MVDVELLRWPADRDRRERLRRSGSPRLLLVEGATEPPTPADVLEDWIRIPAERADVRARIAALILRAGVSGDAAIVIDETGSLRHGGDPVALPPVEARILGHLLDHVDHVVSRPDLIGAVWPGDPPNRNVLDVHLVRLRRRIGSAGLQIRTIRSRGLLLERI